MKMGQLSWRPMEGLCAIAVLKAASAARCRSSNRLSLHTREVLCVLANRSVTSRAQTLLQCFQFLDVIFEPGLDVVFRCPAEHLFGFFDDHRLFCRARLLAWHDLDLELWQQFFRNCDQIVEFDHDTGTDVENNRFL